MEENVEKKTRRPRIGENKSEAADSNENRYEKVDYNTEKRSDNASQQGEYSQNYGSQRGDYGEQRPFATRTSYYRVEDTVVHLLCRFGHEALDAS